MIIRAETPGIEKTSRTFKVMRKKDNKTEKMKKRKQ